MRGQLRSAGLTWTAFIVAVVLIAAGSGYSGYQVGLHASRPTARAAAITPSQQPSTAPSTSPSAAATPEFGGFGPVTPIHNTVVDALQCKLPVYLPGKRRTGGFITFPDGTVQPDASSGVAAPGTSTGEGDPGDWFGLTYDSAVKSWLPVPYAWVSPDGAFYAFAMDPLRHQGNQLGNQLIVVNALTGTSGVLVSLPPVFPPWQVIGVSHMYVYAISTQATGIFVVPTSGPWNNENYVQDGYWTAASGYYWYGSNIPDGGAIVRIDARNPTQRVPWFNKSASAQIIGFDGSGSPVIWTGTDLWIASAPDQATRIASTPPLPLPAAPSGTAPLYGSQAPVSDSHGLWFSARDGIYLYQGGQTTKVSNLVAQVAGSCN